MWEARASAGRGAELLTWVREQEFTAEPMRHEVYTAPTDRVLVITWWSEPYSADLPELPDPPAELLLRPVHRWRFTRMD